MNNAEVVVAPSFQDVAPKQWRHKYDKIVFLKLQGWTHAQIADEVNLSISRVNIVLNSRPGKERMELWRSRLEERTMLTIEEDLMSLGKRAVKNIAETINADVGMKSRAKKHQDSVSFEVLARIGFNKTEKKPVDPGSGLGGLRPDLQERIAEALEKSEEATRIYDMPTQDAEFEPVDDNTTD